MAEYEVKPIYEFTLEELVSELGSRFDCVVVTGVGDRSKDTEERLLQWRGSPCTALGLFEFARHRLNAELDGFTVSLDEDDDDKGEPEFD